MIGLPLMAMMIAAAYQFLFGSLLHSGNTSSTSRTKSTCEFDRPEVEETLGLGF